MKQPNELKKRTTNEYFGKVFSALYKKWKEKTPDGNQQKFAELCRLADKNSVSNYSRGKSIPTDASVDEIIRVFNEAGMNVTVDDFIPRTDDDTYRYDPSRVKAIQDHHQKFAEEIGLSDGFLKFIFDHTDFDDPNEGYPVWSPLAIVPNSGKPFKTDIEDLKYLNDFLLVDEFGRMALKKTHAVTENQKFTVKMQDGSSIILSEIDLRILKDLQDKVVDMVKYLYFIRRKEMKSQEINATKQANPQIPTTGGRGIGYGVSLSKDDLIAIDPYLQYVKFVDKNGKEV